MTLRELQKRVNEVIAENDRIAAKGWDGSLNRNDLPLAVCLSSHKVDRRKRGGRRYETRYVQVNRLDASRCGLGTAGDFICLTADEDEGHLWPPTKQPEVQQ